MFMSPSTDRMFYFSSFTAISFVDLINLSFESKSLIRKLQFNKLVISK